MHGRWPRTCTGRGRPRWGRQMASRFRQWQARVDFPGMHLLVTTDGPSRRLGEEPT